MATFSSTFALDHTTDAGFRVWGGGISALLTAAGLTQTTDTGQINWASVTRAGTNTDAGYEVWRFNDTLQATAPVFFKIRYGTNTTSSLPRIQIDVGPGSDGAGNLTGSTASTVSIVSSSSNTTASWNGVSLAGGCLCLHLFQDNPNAQGIFILERTRASATGAADARGVSFFGKSNFTSSVAGGTYLYATSAWLTTTAVPSYWPLSSNTTGLIGTQIFVGPWVPASGDNTHGPLERTLGFIMYGSSDFSAGNVFTVTRWDG